VTAHPGGSRRRHLRGSPSRRSSRPDGVSSGTPRSGPRRERHEQVPRGVRPRSGRGGARRSSASRPQAARARQAARKVATRSARVTEARRSRASSRTALEGSDRGELYIVGEGDSAGGSIPSRVRPELPGHPAASRQDPERREGQHRQGLERGESQAMIRRDRRCGETSTSRRCR